MQMVLQRLLSDPIFLRVEALTEGQARRGIDSLAIEAQRTIQRQWALISIGRLLKGSYRIDLELLGGLVAQRAPVSDLFPRPRGTPIAVQQVSTRYQRDRGRGVEAAHTTFFAVCHHSQLVPQPLHLRTDPDQSRFVPLIVGVHAGLANGTRFQEDLDVVKSFGLRLHDRLERPHTPLGRIQLVFRRDRSLLGPEIHLLLSVSCKAAIRARPMRIDFPGQQPTRRAPLGSDHGCGPAGLPSAVFMSLGDLHGGLARSPNMRAVLG